MSIIKNVALIAGGIWLWNKLKESGPGEYTAPGVDYLPDKYSPNPYIPPDSILNEDQVYHIGLPVQGVPEGVSAVVPIDTYTAVNAMEPVDMQLTINKFLDHWIDSGMSELQIRDRLTSLTTVLSSSVDEVLQLVGIQQAPINTDENISRASVMEIDPAMAEALRKEIELHYYELDPAYRILYS